MKTSEPISLEVRLRYYGGTNIARCNGKTASHTGNEDVAVERAAAKALFVIADLMKNPAVVNWPSRVDKIGGGLWRVTYSPPQP